MRKTLHTSLAVAAAMLLFCISSAAQVSPEAFKRWHDSKYSMFIHFGLYSELGGVWNGYKITQGYSEQIQSQAGIFSDEYAEVAESFNPSAFDPDKIVALAKEAGMKSIVITSKHHDGFCMWRTATTEFNSWDGTPVSRDFIDELSKACARGGIRFGLYFSLIDWHYPHAYPISSSNADPITPEHHRYNMAQVRELLTGYGDISELWFDMGSLTPQQSRDLYELVHSLQPDCMVSGRLGNDQYDFCVMGDNAFPSGTLKSAWQTPASIFSETWGYRSWQERGSSELKAAEKLRSLIGVVAHGGNYLLNIGPKGDGSVVEFEEEVLLKVGSWLKVNQEAIYGAEPFAVPSITDDSIFFTRKGNDIFIIPSDVPQGCELTIPLQGRKLLGAKFLDSNDKATVSLKGNTLSVKVPAVKSDEFCRVIRLSFNSPLPEIKSDAIRANGKSLVLMSSNAVEDNSYSCFDYYTNYKSVIGYGWNVTGIQAKAMEISFTEDQLGREVEIEVDGKKYITTLTASPIKLSEPGAVWSDTYYCIRGGSFSRRLPSKIYDINNPDAPEKWTVAKGSVLEKAKTNCTVYVARDITVEKDCDVVVEFAAGNGVEVLLNGQSLLKHLNPYHETERHEKILVHLKKGNNQILVGAFNKWEKTVPLVLKPADDNSVYRMSVKLDAPLSKAKEHSIHIQPADMSNSHTDIEMSNIEITLK